MTKQNRVSACHHIELQDGCQWCKVYQQQSVRACDRCKSMVHTDVVFLSLRGSAPELICVHCHHDENKWGA